MGPKYVKNIPEKVWFQEYLDSEWLAGPFVKKPKGSGKFLAFRLVPDEEYMKFSIPIGELTEEQAIERLKELRALYSEDLDLPDAEIYLKPNGTD